MDRTRLGRVADDPDEPPGYSVDAVYRAEAPRLSRYFRFRARCPDDAADLVQEVFVRFLRRTTARDLGNPAAYLHRIARNLLVDGGRRRACRPVIETRGEVHGVEAMPADQSYAIEASQMMDAYQRAVDALAPRTREVFLLHRVDELSYKEIAARLGISTRTVEWHIAEALVRVRRMLDEE